MKNATISKCRFSLLNILKLILGLMMLDMIWASLISIFIIMPDIISDFSWGAAIHTAYQLITVIGLTFILINCFLLSGVKEELLSIKSRKQFIRLGYSFLILTVVSVIAQMIDKNLSKEHLLEIFNFNITVDVILYMIGAVVFLSLAEYIKDIDECREDRSLTI